MDGVRKRLNRYFWLLSLISQGETDLHVWFGQVPFLLTFIQAWDQHWEYASFCPLLSNWRSFASKVNMFTTEQANQSNVCNQLDQASSHSSPNDTWTHEVHRGLGYLCVCLCACIYSLPSQPRSWHGAGYFQEQLWLPHQSILSWAVQPPNWGPWTHPPNPQVL